MLLCHDTELMGAYGARSIHRLRRSKRLGSPNVRGTTAVPTTLIYTFLMRGLRETPLVSCPCNTNESLFYRDRSGLAAVLLEGEGGYREQGAL